MSYAIAAALQVAVFQKLAADTAVTQALGDAIYDAVPAGDVPNTYLTLGPEDVRDRSNKTGQGAEHRFVLSVVTTLAGFRAAKAAAGAVTDAIVNADLALERGQLISLRFLRARALRTRSADGRRIDLTFRAIVEDD